MDSMFSRKQFLSMLATGAAGCLVSPELSFASGLDNSDDKEKSSESVLLRYQDSRYPALKICIVDPDHADAPTIDPSSVEVRTYKNKVLETGTIGETVCEFDIKVTEFDKHRLSSDQGIALFSSTTNEASDVVASVKVKATWNLSADKKKINLTKVNVTFNQKKGTVTDRNILIVNDGKQYKNTNIGLNYSYSPTWGYRDYHDLKRESNHFVNVWAMAEATGMGGRRELNCMLIYGS